MTKSTTRNIVIAVISLIVSSAIFGFLVFKVVKQGDQLIKQNETLNRETQQASSHNKLRRLVDDTVNERALLASYFLEKEGSSIDFLNSVESLALQNGLIFKTEKLDVVINKDDESTWIQADFSFSSSKESVLDFIQILETLPYVMKISSVQMKALSSSLWSVNVSLQVRLLNL